MTGNKSDTRPTGRQPESGADASRLPLELGAGKAESETEKRPPLAERIGSLRRFRGRLPTEFRFDRSEANRTIANLHKGD